MKPDYEVLIVGGGPAGLSAAMTLGRMVRTALVCDDGRPRNAPSSHVNNFPSRDGVHPNEWRMATRRDLEKYETIRLATTSVRSIRREGSGFTAELASGENLHVRKIILADGLKDRMLPVPGFQELWGRSIFHCPFCHGFEIRGTRLGMIIKNDMAFHALEMVHSLAKDLTVFTDGPGRLDADQRATLARKNIAFREEKLEGLEREGDRLRAVNLAGGQRIERDFLFYAAEMPFELKTDLGIRLGCERNEFGLYKLGERNATSVPGVFAAGDNASFAQSVLLASASGVMAAFGAIAELLHEA